MNGSGTRRIPPQPRPTNSAIHRDRRDLQRDAETWGEAVNG